MPAQDANELWSVQRYSTEECDGRSNSSSTQVQLVMRGKRRFQEELNLNRLAVQFSAVQHRVSAASCGHDPEDDLDRNHAQVEEGCRDCPHFPSPHVNLTTRNHSTTRKSWRSDAPIILPGWEYHTGGSRSKPTVHRCRPKTGGCGLLARTQNEPTKQHGSGVENQHGSGVENQHYHTGTLVYSTARAGTSCKKKEGRISNSSIIRWTFFQFRSTSSRKDDLMDIDMVKSRETRNTIRLIS